MNLTEITNIAYIGYFTQQITPCLCCHYAFRWPRMWIKKNIQESLANANVSARQQCMYEGHYRRNLSSVENPTVEANIMSLSCKQPMLFYPVPTPGYLVGLYEIFLVLNRCPCNRKKKSGLKQNLKSTQPQNKFRRVHHLLQSNVAVSQIKWIQQN